MRYRREIDGLRAVAVLPVILFHAGLKGFAGGYAGVDVFFVISGFLITGLILQEKEENRFSILSFYERRARRILPALLTVMLVCLPFAWRWMLPLPYEEFAQSLIATLLFTSNLLFWRETGYFAAAAEEKPLLHTWSLAVEEQFYIFFPLFILLIWRFGKARMVYAIALIAAVSLALAEYASHHYVAANFYLLTFRAWELLAGSLAAFALRHRGPWHSDVLSLSGLLLILGAIFFLEGGTRWPSVYTLVPVLGTVLILLCAGPNTFACRLLSTRVLVGVGLISYSAYLWHQPLFAFARIRNFTNPPQELMIGLAALSLLLAWGTWWLLEQPFRKRQRIAAKPALIMGAVASLCILISGVYGSVTQGFPARLPEETIAFLATRDVQKNKIDPCHNYYEGHAERVLSDPCVLYEGVKPSALIIGDSHAAVALAGLRASFKKAGKNAYVVVGSWCVPLLHFGVVDSPEKNPQCKQVMTNALLQAAKRSDIDTVLLIAQWPNYLKGYRWRDDDIARYSNDTYEAKSPAENKIVFEKSLQDTLHLLSDSGKKIILATTVPEYEFDVGLAYAKAALFQVDFSYLLPKNIYQTRNEEFLNILSRTTPQFPRLHVFETTTSLCDNEYCHPLSKDGQLLYRDDNHLSKIGSEKTFGPLEPNIP